ncbi:hypothetical protein Y1Q_0014843 [Alligator mississippiensis]|uniref:Uncharacterized protein n=1 Tax=Alligator mississippiensis TaxID=8496 RepID=A0A151M292_ALLMI|nr:hypothetical protein Y1Q_0014843 [Alligator mississippiensis]
MLWPLSGSRIAVQGAAALKSNTEQLHSTGPWCIQSSLEMSGIHGSASAPHPWLSLAAAPLAWRGFALALLVFPPR